MPVASIGYSITAERRQRAADRRADDRRRARHRAGSGDAARQVPLGAKDGRFPEYLARLLGAPLTSGNLYIVHTNGEAAFPAMLDAIGRARHRVSLETYIYNRGEIANRFTAALEAAARRGVEVRLVLDSVGAKMMDPEHVKRLTDAGMPDRLVQPGEWVRAAGAELPHASKVTCG